MGVCLAALFLMGSFRADRRWSPLAAVLTNGARSSADAHLVVARLTPTCRQVGRPLASAIAAHSVT
jgi:hypothetical protein